MSVHWGHFECGFSYDDAGPSAFWSATPMKTEMSKKTINWIEMKSHGDIHSPQRLNPTDFGDPLNFHLAPLAFHSKLYLQIKYLR